MEAPDKLLDAQLRGTLDPSKALFAEMGGKLGLFSPDLFAQVERAFLNKKARDLPLAPTLETWFFDMEPRLRQTKSQRILTASSLRKRVMLGRGELENRAFAFSTRAPRTMPGGGWSLISQSLMGSKQIAAGQFFY
jgi:hypothetical protein